jgi:hypothetical protein
MVIRSVRGEQVAGPGGFLLFDKMYWFARRHPTRWAKTLLLVASIGVHGCLVFRVLRVWLSRPSGGMTLVTETRSRRRYKSRCRVSDLSLALVTRGRLYNLL